MNLLIFLHDIPRKYQERKWKIDNFKKKKESRGKSLTNIEFQGIYRETNVVQNTESIREGNVCKMEANAAIGSQAVSSQGMCSRKEGTLKI